MKDSMPPDPDTAGPEGRREAEAVRLREVFARYGIRDRGPKTAKTAARHARDALMRFRDLANDDLEDSEIVTLEEASMIFLLREDGPL